MSGIYRAGRGNALGGTLVPSNYSSEQAQSVVQPQPGQEANVKKSKAAKLGPKDALPAAQVKRMWRAGKNLSEIAQAIGTGLRPNGTGYRIGRIRALLAKAALYPHKAK
jgi:hypothetical protein